MHSPINALSRFGRPFHTVPTTPLYAAILALCAVPHAYAQTAPAGNSAGNILQQNQGLLAPDNDTRTAAPPPDPIHPGASSPSASVPPQTVYVQHFELDKPLDEPLAMQVRRLLASAEGRDLTFAQIVQVRDKLTALLQSHYGILTFVVVPEQDASKGTLRFQMIRGRVESITLRNRSRVSDDTLERIFRTRQIATLSASEQGGVDRVLHAANLARALPGVASITPTLTEGATEGGTKVMVDVAPAPAFEAAVVTDNAGSAGSGRYRVGTQLTVNNPLGIGDRARVLGYAAPGSVQDRIGRDGRTWIGLASYDAPLGFSGTRAGIQYSKVGYALGGGLKDLGSGYASVVSFYANHPLVLTSRNEFRMGVQYSRKNLNDEFFGINALRRSNVASLLAYGTHYGQLAGKPNGLQYSSELDVGSLWLVDLGLTADPRTSGRSTKWTGSADFTQLLWRGADIRARVSAQLASKHLDPSEQMSLGGPNAVRAYGYDVPNVDQGALASLDLSQQIPRLTGVSTRVFADVGRGQINRNGGVFGSDNTWMAAGYGVGLTYQYRNRLRLDLAQAFRLGTPRGMAPDRSQTWFTATYFL
ncbi:ShlB/FhaC/HecB family hemolysin secretion/activation protein [Dyella flava]|uniref:ShlB/FhaC/HecB family hemolysin secretion/activation protein n=1 Tax=Dyella flava TaxID=1920170 RepID=A0ABS2K296_9GAMM|nr:ShlB/FhaC/HecB family hemolysin secretion/activation protein [Dyella flava]MBM7124780.1 ShlB/FhaC/HecB family hemolysin secretion/activation protein [Dyella flava]GLQ50825.1 polypeptide-transport-associated domain protein shlb-type [Dyella flava]